MQNANSAIPVDSSSCEAGVLHYRTEGVYCQGCLKIWKCHGNAQKFDINDGS